MWRRGSGSGVGSCGGLAAPLLPKALQCSVAVNSAHAVPFENDLARGRVLIMHSVPAGSGRSSPYEKYLEADEAGTRPRRICDIHLQFELKERPRGGRLWVGGECRTPLQFGPAMKATCKVMLSLIRKVGGVPIHYSFGGPEEHSHISFPLSLWPVLVTPSDTDWPELGERLPNIPTDAVCATFTPGSVYTFSVPDRFLDLEEWEVRNTPSTSINGMSMSKVFQNNGFHFIVYDTPDGLWTSNGGVGKGPHVASERRCFLDVTVSNRCLQAPSEAALSPREVQGESPEAPTSIGSAVGAAGLSLAESCDPELDDDVGSFYSADSDVDAEFEREERLVEQVGQPSQRGPQEQGRAKAEAGPECQPGLRTTLAASSGQLTGIAPGTFAAGTENWALETSDCASADEDSRTGCWERPRMCVEDLHRSLVRLRRVA